jgi:hypothetical protein
VTPGDFIAAVREEFPELDSVIKEDDGLFYLQVGSLVSYTQGAIDDGDSREVQRQFEFMRRAWLAGDDEVLAPLIAALCRLWPGQAAACADQMTATERITVGGISFTAEMNGHVSPAGFIVLNGTVTGRSFVGAQVHQRSNLVGAAGTTTSWTGALQLMPASA